MFIKSGKPNVQSTGEECEYQVTGTSGPSRPGRKRSSPGRPTREDWVWFGAVYNLCLHLIKLGTIGDALFDISKSEQSILLHYFAFQNQNKVIVCWRALLDITE